MSDDERSVARPAGSAEGTNPPEITPWGERTEPDTFFGGFWWVSASIHGGLYLTEQQRTAIPENLKEHSRDGDGIWWEENSAWSLPVVCLLSRRPEASLSDEEQEKLDSADQTCRDNYPREWEELTGRKLMPGESQALDDATRERHGFDDSGPLERGTRFHALALTPDEDEQARNAERMHIQVLHPGDEGNEFTKIYAVAPAIMRELELLDSKPAGEELALWLAGKGCKLDYEDGPAVVEHRADGGNRRTWYRDGHWHCDHGPALREYAANGSALFEDYFLEGGRVAKEVVVFPERGKFDALLDAAEKGETAEVNRLLESDAPIHGCADAPLRAAALHGHGETVRALVEAGAEVDAWDGMALRCMVYRGDTETVKFLLDKGANIFAIEDKVIQETERQGRSELASMLRDAGAARMGVTQDKGRGGHEDLTAKESMPEAKVRRTLGKEAESVGPAVAATTRIAPYISGSGTVDLMIRVPEPVKSRTDEPKPGTPKQNRTQTKEPPAEGLKKGADREPKPETLEPKPDEAHNKAESERQKTRSRPKRDRGWDRDR